MKRRTFMAGVVVPFFAIITARRAPPKKPAPMPPAKRTELDADFLRAYERHVLDELLERST